MWLSMYVANCSVQYRTGSADDSKQHALWQCMWYYRYHANDHKPCASTHYAPYTCIRHLAFQLHVQTCSCTHCRSMCSHLHMQQYYKNTCSSIAINAVKSEYAKAPSKSGNALNYHVHVHVCSTIHSLECFSPWYPAEWPSWFEPRGLQYSRRYSSSSLRTS